jgi:hypothetical protein
MLKRKCEFSLTSDRMTETHRMIILRPRGGRPMWTIQYRKVWFAAIRYFRTCGNCALENQIALIPAAGCSPHICLSQGESEIVAIRFGSTGICPPNWADTGPKSRRTRETGPFQPTQKVLLLTFNSLRGGLERWDTSIRIIGASAA